MTNHTPLPEPFGDLRAVLENLNTLVERLQVANGGTTEALDKISGAPSDHEGEGMAADDSLMGQIKVACHRLQGAIETTERNSRRLSSLV